MTQLIEQSGVSWKQKLLERAAQGYRHLSGMEACSICGTPIQERQGPLVVCHQCFRVVPWITKVRCLTCGRGIECGDCGRRKETYFVQNRSSVRYDDTMKDWLARWKYRGDEKMAGLFGDMLLHPYHCYREQGIVFDLISYVPVSPKRLEERGFNQAEELAKGLGRRLKLPVKRLLERVVHTDKQSFKSRQERLDDMAGVFALREVETAGVNRPNRRTLLLIDDVYTTGSTLNHCARLLTSVNDATVFGLTWAR